MLNFPNLWAAMNKNRLFSLITTSLRFFIFFSIVSNGGFSSISKEQKAIPETPFCGSHHATPLLNHPHTLNVSEFIQALKNPLQEKIMPTSLLRAACLNLEMLRDTRDAANDEERIELFRQAVFNGIMGIQIFYEVARDMPDEASSFFAVLKPFHMNEEEEKALAELTQKGKDAEALAGRKLIGTFLKIPDEKKQAVTAALLQTLVVALKKKIEENFCLAASQQIFDMSKLIINPKLVEFALSFGIPGRAMMDAIGLHLVSQKWNVLAEQWYRRAAEKELFGATYILGFLFYEQGKKDEAEAYLRQAVGKEDTVAMAALGSLLAEQDHKKEEAEAWLRRAAEKGHSRAMYNLGFLLNKQGREEDAKEWLGKAVGEGLPEAIHELALLLDKQGEKKKARELLKKIADERFPEAMYSLALLLNKQKKREKEAVEFFRRAAEQGHPDAMYNLGVLLYKQGKKKGAIDWYKSAAEKGIPEAMLNLGAIFAEQGNKERAKKWYEKAAAKKLPEAMYNLGLLLEEEGNKEGAKKRYKDAAVKGLPEAMHALGFLLCELGEDEEAEVWLERAADQGHLGAMANLGFFLCKQKNEEKAKEWLGRAAEKGHLEAIHNLAVLLAAQGNKEGAKKWYTEAVNKGFCKDLINIALMLPDTHPDKPKLYQKAIGLGVKDAEILYADFLERQGNLKEASEFLDFYDLRQDHEAEGDRASSSDDELSEKSASPAFVGCSKEESKEEESHSVESPPTDGSSSDGTSDEKDEVLGIPKRLQKRIERQKRAAEAQTLGMVFPLKSGRAETPKSYKDVMVLAPSALHEKIKKNIKIQGLISCLANGELRANCEKLKADKNLYSMRLSQKDRLVFRILERDVKGVKSLEILSVEGHYILEAGESTEVSWEEDR